MGDSTVGGAHPSQALKLRDALEGAPGVIYRVYRTQPFALLGTHRG